MKNMKKVIPFIMSLVMMSAVSIPTYAVTETKDNGRVISNDHAYYDEELGAYVVSFTVNNDKSLNYLTKPEARTLTARTAELPELIDSESQIMPRDNYREWYTFTKTSGPTKANGKRKKVSADFIGPTEGGSVSKNVSFSISQTFSTNVSRAAEKSAIQAGCGFSWTKSASTSTTYTANLSAGQKGYLSFTPYYDKVGGTLDFYTNWDGKVSSKSATGYSVKTTDDGEPDGVYQFIYY